MSYRGRVEFSSFSVIPNTSTLRGYLLLRVIHISILCFLVSPGSHVIWGILVGRYIVIQSCYPVRRGWQTWSIANLRELVASRRQVGHENVAEMSNSRKICNCRGWVPKSTSKSLVQSWREKSCTHVQLNTNVPILTVPVHGEHWSLDASALEECVPLTFGRQERNKLNKLCVRLGEFPKCVEERDILPIMWQIIMSTYAIALIHSITIHQSCCCARILICELSWALPLVSEIWTVCFTQVRIKYRHCVRLPVHRRRPAWAWHGISKVNPRRMHIPDHNECRFKTKSQSTTKVICGRCQRSQNKLSDQFKRTGSRFNWSL